MNGPQPFLLAYDGVSPRFASAPAHAGAGAAVLGRATLGKSAWLGARSVIRADGHYIEIGDDFRLGARATVHIAHAVSADTHRLGRHRGRQFGHSRLRRWRPLSYRPRRCHSRRLQRRCRVRPRRRLNCIPALGSRERLALFRQSRQAGPQTNGPRAGGPSRAIARCRR